MAANTKVPELSIIIVNWNTRDLTLTCLESIYRSPIGVGYEIIVIDNGSSDGSADAIANQYPEVRLVRESVNHGFAIANNIAAKVARGQYLLLLNSDTEVTEGSINRLISFAANRPSARIWGGRTIFADGTLNPMSAWGRLTLWSTVCFSFGLTRLFSRSSFFNPEGLGGWDRASEREVDIVSGCYFLIERAFWTELGGFDPLFFMYGEEADLCRRARAFGARPRVTPTSTIVHHGGASGTRTDTTSYVLGAKIELARRSMSGWAAAATRLLLLFAVGLRCAAFAIAAKVSNRARVPARHWSQIWKQRERWSIGPIAAGTRF